LKAEVIRKNENLEIFEGSPKIIKLSNHRMFIESLKANSMLEIPPEL
jgi:hypothetical protein